MFYNIRYNDIIPTVITYPNPDKTSALSEKKYYPNPGVNVGDFFDPNVYLYNPRLFNEPSVYEYQNINKDENLRNEVVKFFQEKIIKWIKTKKEFAKFNKNEIESKEGYNKLYEIIRKFVNHKKYNWYDLRGDYEELREYIANKYWKL